MDLFARRKAAVSLMGTMVVVLSCASSGCGSGDDRARGKADWGYANPYYSQSAWAAGHRDSRNSDYVPVEGPLGLSRAWEFKGVFVGLAAVTGRRDAVYVATGDRGEAHLFALSSRTGDVLWRSDLVRPLATTSSPTVDADGNLYVADDSFMYSFSPEGSLRWKSEVDSNGFGSQLASDGKLIYASRTGFLYVFERKTGRPVMGRPYDVRAHMGEPQGLQRRAGRPLPGRERSPPRGAGALSAAPFACMLTTGYLDPSLAEMVECVVGGGSGGSRCTLNNTLCIDPETNVIYATLAGMNEGDPASLIALAYLPGDPGGFEPLWTASVPGGTDSSPALSFDGRTVYVTDTEDNLLAISTSEGRIRWGYPIGFSPNGSVALTPDGRLYPAFPWPIGDPKGAFLGLKDMGDHADLLFRSAEYAPLSIPVPTANDHIYVYCRKRPLGERALRVFDAWTGRLIEESEPFTQSFATLAYPDGKGFVTMTTNDFGCEGGIHAFRSTRP